MNISSFLKRKSSTKIIYHAGAWVGNFGDSIIQQSIKNNLQELSRDELEFRYIKCQQTEFTKDIIERINSDGDVLIVGGGGLIFYRPQDNSKSGWQWNIDIDLIDEIKIPLVIYGVGYNQFEYDTTNFVPITNRHLQKTVERASLCSVRNTGSKRELIARGCNGNKIQVIPDSGMFAKSKKIHIPGIKKNKLKIGFNWTTDREDQTFPPPHKENKKKFLDACTDLLNYAIEEKNAQIYYIGHMGHGFDQNIIMLLKEKLVSTPIVIDEVLQEIYPPSADKAGYLIDVYRQMDLVLGMRGHSNIVSFGQNTPFIGLGSHRKLRYFLEDLGRDKYFFDVRPDGNQYSMENMKIILLDIINNSHDHKNKMKIMLSDQKIIFNDFNQKIIDLL
ncbi:MAG TPA: polysaccharide pyruvyl transferase family protein [Spirochaetota bacterium]|nr:polysaccharide pyruvyl transferase family protein [Spirochaetota bacterium]HRT77455.1 polysaccharide pyruvyl transferase family protein [Spirochaetota bacterium]